MFDDSHLYAFVVRLFLVSPGAIHFWVLDVMLLLHVRCESVTNYRYPALYCVRSSTVLLITQVHLFLDRVFPFLQF